MSIEVKVPAVGESVSSGIIAAWHKKTGDYVEANEAIMTLETDKVSTEIVAEKSGVLTIQAEEGDEVKVGQVIGEIDPDAEKPSGDHSDETPTTPPDAAEKEVSESKTDGATSDDPKTSPASRRALEESDLAASEVPQGSLPGRVTKEDVANHSEKGRDSAPSENTPAQKPVESAPAREPKSPLPSQPAGERTTRKKMTPLRRRIASQLVNAQQTAAILTTFNEADMSAIMGLRKKAQDNFVKKHGVKLGFMSFFIKAVVEALKSVPVINARIDGDELVENHYYDIGVAVGTQKGLVVPVVRDADQKSFADLEKELADVAGKARDGKLKIEDLQGGVFTISNGGIYGSLLSTPILNPPQSGILGMHTIQERPIARNGEVVIRPMMYLALSYDHRVVDGKEAVTFLIRVKECIEDPTRLLLEF